jgi:hypothetical protein
MYSRTVGRGLLDESERGSSRRPVEGVGEGYAPVRFVGL